MKSEIDRGVGGRCHFIQNGHGDAILAQGAKASPRVKGQVVMAFS